VQFTGRVFFFEVAPSDVTPVLWVVMGAAAIGANAGSELVLVSVNLPLLQLYCFHTGLNRSAGGRVYRTAL